MRAFTSIEQSRQLAEILPIESADMYWIHVQSEDTSRNFWKIEIIQGVFKPFSMNIRCWSLASLLEIINKDFYTDLYHDGETWTVDVQHHDNEEMNDFVYADEPIDACVEMIVKLKEKGLI